MLMMQTRQVMLKRGAPRALKSWGSEVTPFATTLSFKTWYKINNPLPKHHWMVCIALQPHQSWQKELMLEDGWFCKIFWMKRSQKVSFPTFMTLECVAGFAQAINRDSDPFGTWSSKLQKLGTIIKRMFMFTWQQPYLQISAKVPH